MVQIIEAWDHQCAFCGFDGQLGASLVGIEAAHVRWFNLGGPDEPDSGLALCSLHHKLFDRGALGLSPTQERRCRRQQHRRWHDREVFRGAGLAA